MSSGKKDTGKSSPQSESSSYKRSKLELKAEQLLKEAELDTYEIEYKFCDTRRWRFDFAWPKHKVALEVEGGVWQGKRGGHTSGKGYSKDCEKYNTAVLLGWRVIRVTNVHLRNKQMVNWIGAIIPKEIGDDPFPVDNLEFFI